MSEATQKLYILEPRLDSLRSAEVFLRNRNWHLRSTTRLKEFLALVMKDQPPVVMICIDHPHPKAAALPKVISSAFPNVQVIAFVNSTSSAAMSLLKNTGCEYHLFAPVSGPAVERMVLRIHKDLQKKQEDAARAAERGDFGDAADGATDENGKLINIKGEGQQKGGSATQQTNQARQALAQFMQNTGESEDSAPAYMPSGGPAAFANELTDGMPGASDGSVSNTGARAGASAKRRAPLVMSSGSRYRRGPLIMGTLSGSEVARMNLRKNAASLNFRPVDEEEETQNDEWMRKDPSTGAPVFESEWKRRDRNTGLPVFEEGEWERKKKGTPTFHRDDSIILKGTRDAMEKAAIKGRPGRTTEKVKKASRVACVSVESARFNGYLVAAFGANRQMDQRFVATVRARLIEFMRAQGEEFAAEDGLELNLEEVEFEDWALEQAEFLRKTVHDGNEVAMAFFPDRAKDIPLEVSADKNMLQLDLDELVGDTTVEFDVYVYMPANKKYVHYTRQGQKLYGDQKDRLKSKGVQKMHLREDGAKDVRRYRVRNFLNDKIANFKKARDPKAG